MAMFKRQPHHEFICTISSSRKMRVEEDEDLYFNTQERYFFILDQIEYDGPSVTGTFTTRQIVIFP